MRSVILSFQESVYLSTTMAANDPLAMIELIYTTSCYEGTILVSARGVEEQYCSTMYWQMMELLEQLR